MTHCIQELSMARTRSLPLATVNFRSGSRALGLVLASLTLGGWSSLPRLRDEPASMPPAQTVQFFTPTSKKVVARGYSLKLGHYGTYHLDCTQMGTAEVRITTSPQHGTVTLKDGKDYASFLSTSPYRHCSSAPVNGRIATYTPTAGYIGPDTLTLDVIYANGTETTRTFDIEVK